MTDTTNLTKQRVREWLEQRMLEEDAPPSPEEIRQQLGWRILPHNDNTEFTDD